jgi:hypothetical protein
MKISEFPEDFKLYILVLSNKSEYKVTGKQKEAIINSNSNFAQLPNGSVINKAFIIEFKLDFEETKAFIEKNKGKLALVSNL